MLRLLLPCLVISAAAIAAEPEAVRHLLILDRPPSLTEIERTAKYARHLLAQAGASGQEVDLRVARDEDLVLINVRAPALCSPDRGCPLLAFRTIGRKPVLETVAFANVVVFRPPKKPDDLHIITQSGQGLTDCLIPPMGRVKCGPAR